jgi:hypothetical protein
LFLPATSASAAIRLTLAHALPEVGGPVPSVDAVRRSMPR